MAEWSECLEHWRKRPVGAIELGRVVMSSSPGMLLLGAAIEKHEGLRTGSVASGALDGPPSVTSGLVGSSPPSVTVTVLSARKNRPPRGGLVALADRSLVALSTQAKRWGFPRTC